MRIAGQLMAALALWLMFPCALHAQPASNSKLDEILARGTLRVGMPGDYLPFALRDKLTGHWQGLDVDEAGAMAKALGVNLEIVQTSWQALMPDLHNGKFDIAAGGISVTLERQKTAFFSTPIMQDGKTAITRCASAARFATLADIDKPDVRVITNPGGTNEAFDRAHLHPAKIIIFRDNTRVFGELIAGGADGLSLSDGLAFRQRRRG